MLKKKPKLKIGQDAFYIDGWNYDIPKLKRIKITGHCMDTSSMGYEATEYDTENKDDNEIHTCNLTIFKNEKEANKAFNEYCWDAIKRLEGEKAELEKLIVKFILMVKENE